MYIAKHKNADTIVGPGVIAFTAEFIESTRDANRSGIPRLDLVIRHSDGGYVRLHPGSKQKTMLFRDSSQAVLQSMPRVSSQAMLQCMLHMNGVRLAKAESSRPLAQILCHRLTSSAKRTSGKPYKP